MSVSHLIRKYIELGMTIDGHKANIDFIRQQIREEIRMLLNPQVDRMVKISLKGGIVAAAGYFLSASTLQKFVPLERQKDYSEVLEEAKKLGVHYFKLPTKEATDFL